jgi:hypothetical protein
MSAAKNILNSVRLGGREAGRPEEKVYRGSRPFPSRVSYPFIRTTPLAWIQAASPIKGKALAVGVAIWYQAGLKKSQRVKLPSSLLRAFGINRHSGYRALRELERAGLLKVERRRGECPVVEIIDRVDCNNPL